MSIAKVITKTFKQEMVSYSDSKRFSWLPMWFPMNRIRTYEGQK